MSKYHPDAEVITRLGGPAELARLLGFDTRIGVQRVQNWKSRGVPEIVKLRRPDIDWSTRTEKEKAA